MADNNLFSQLDKIKKYSDYLTMLIAWKDKFFNTDESI